MKTWQSRNELAGECCGLDNVLEVETDGDGVCDGDRARCTRHGCEGVVLEAGGHMHIVWSESEEG